MTAKANTKSRNAFTIVEIMIAVIIVLIAIIGTSAYRYGALLNTRRADLHATAVRAAQMLCEGWNGTCGAASFNPDTAFGTNIDISPSDGPDAPDGFTPLGSYTITLEDTEYYATLSWENTEADLRTLSVIVSWDPTGQNAGGPDNAIKSYQLITYFENPS
jgi:type II secretory pathway pseudopilin PulG